MTAETYVKLIVKRVKCSKKKRGEMRRQLLADIAAEVENGMTFENVMLQMGEPIAIADEFNENLSEAERKKYKRHLAAKVLACVAAAIAVLSCVVFWFLPKGMPFGSSGLFTTQAIEAQSKDVIRLLDEKDYDGLAACSDSAMSLFFSNNGQEEIEQAKEQIGTDWGICKTFGKFYMQEIKQKGKVLALAQVNVAYEKAGVTYTLVFDRDMKLSGLYFK